MNGKRITRISHFIVLLFLVFLIVCSSCGDSHTTSPLSPEDALKSFRLPAGFRIELVASEPLISDPVEVAFDTHGRMYVAEMEDYPAEHNVGGRIVLLEDRDADGYYETGTVFADSLPYVNGVMPWQKGVLVTTAPDILYLEDTDGDHQADIREVILTGFAFTNPQLRMSSLRYGLDNWIYGAYSRSGGQRGYPEFTDHGKALRFPKDRTGDSIDIYPGTDFRFRPRLFLAEPSGGMSQFGLAFDAAGNRFTVWNNIHLRHVVIDARYQSVNKWLNIRSLMAHVSDHGDASTVYSRAENRLDLHESEIGHFTSACGHSIYTGGLFPAPYEGAAFVCEPVSNIVHIDLLRKDGPTFSASRSGGEDEFLTSTDSWFRPVNTTVGPDGGLYVVDFYRKLVEHPAWIARADDKGIYTHAGVLQEQDFLEGNDLGRIYRIVPEQYNREVAGPNLESASVEELVKALELDNMWFRTNAQRLLVERQDSAATSLLKDLLRQSSKPHGMVHALWTLNGLHALDETSLLAVLGHQNPEVRRQAIIIAEQHLSKPGIKEGILSMAGDSDTSVQFQVALTLSLLDDETTFAPLQQIMRGHPGDDWFQSAVLLSVRSNAVQWFLGAADFTTTGKETSLAKMKLLKQIASIVGSRKNAVEVSGLISIIEQKADTTTQISGLEGLAQGIGERTSVIRLTSHAQDDLLAMVSSGNKSVRDASVELAGKFILQKSRLLESAVQGARKDVLDEKALPGFRAHAARVLALEGDRMPLAVFEELLDIRQPVELQLAAARILAQSNDPAALSLLLRRWNSCTADVRAILENGIMRSARAPQLLVEAIGSKIVDPSLLSTTLRTRLMQHPDTTVRDKAREVFANVDFDTREEVINSYYESTITKGNSDLGKIVFKTACSPCHQLDNVGRPFGPDLLSVSRQTRINLLTMIVDPNKNIAPGYDGYYMETTDGRTFAGIIANESSSAVVLRTADGGEQIVVRDQIKNMRPLSTSLMPEGLEAGISKKEMADLLEYLKRTEKNAAGERGISHN